MANGEDYPTNFIPGAIREGKSATEALRDFRAAGGRIGNSTWYRSWGQVVSALAKSADIASTPHNRRPDRSLISEWDVKGKSRYLYDFEHQIRFKGTDIIGIKRMSVRTNTLISVGRALQMSLDTLVENEDQYDEVVLGGTLVNVYEFTGE